MLDDFRSEFKKLNLKRFQKEERRHGDDAIFLERTELKSDHCEIEFADNPESADISARLKKNARQTVHNYAIGKMGIKIARLPGLERLSSEAGRPDETQDFIENGD
jgi:hypothetical protein